MIIGANDNGFLVLVFVVVVEVVLVVVVAVEVDAAGNKASELAGMAIHQAQTTMTSTMNNLPRYYSHEEMTDVVQKKNELLAELTHCILSLRNTEENFQALQQ